MDQTTVSRRSLLVAAGFASATLAPSQIAMAQASMKQKSSVVLDPTPAITRHFVTVGDRQVHYRRAGSGPPVFLLHASPGSSLSMVRTMGRLTDKFTVIAPDTPGNGLSTPLPQAVPVMADYANALAELMTALGIDRAPIYGSYTGAGCALEMARLHPDRATLVIVNGYLQFTDGEREDIVANYLPVFEPDWYGGHLVWAYARMREQLIFFPWFHKDDVSRMDTDLPSPAGLHSGVVDLMRSDDNYRAPYRAAFTMDYASSLLAAKAPTIITTSRQDLMWPHLARMPEPPRAVTVHGTDTMADSWTVAVEVLTSTISRTETTTHSSVTPFPDRLWSEMLQVDGVSVNVLRNTKARGRPILFLHDTAGSTAQMAEHLVPLIGKRPVIALDLPGNGETDGEINMATVVDDHARIVRGVIDTIGYDVVDIVAFGGGGAVAVEFALNQPERVKTLLLRQVQCFELAEANDRMNWPLPDLTPAAHGAQMLNAWNFIRDRELFDPWHFQDRKTAIRGRDPDLDPARVHMRTMDLLKCGDGHSALYKAHIGYPMARKLAGLRSDVVLDLPESPSTQRAAAVLPPKSVRVLSLPMVDVSGERLVGVLD
jgi:pimeloyl-ACP methyl ester carboxylesterase